MQDRLRITSTLQFKIIMSVGDSGLKAIMKFLPEKRAE